MTSAEITSNEFSLYAVCKSSVQVFKAELSTKIPHKCTTHKVF